MGALIGKSGDPKGSDSKTIGKTVNTLWLLPGDFSSAASILTNDSLADRSGSFGFNLMGFHFDPMPLASSKKGCKKSFSKPSHYEAA